MVVINTYIDTGSSTQGRSIVKALPMASYSKELSIEAVLFSKCEIQVSMGNSLAGRFRNAVVR